MVLTSTSTSLSIHLDGRCKLASATDAVRYISEMDINNMCWPWACQCHSIDSMDILWLVCWREHLKHSLILSLMELTFTLRISLQVYRISSTRGSRIFKLLYIKTTCNCMENDLEEQVSTQHRFSILVKSVLQAKKSSFLLTTCTVLKVTFIQRPHSKWCSVLLHLSVAVHK